jgi:Zinc knuckle
MTIKELNRKFNSLIVNLKPKPTDTKLRRVYANILKPGATAE